jgi:hypothetical protein
VTPAVLLGLLHRHAGDLSYADDLLVATVRELLHAALGRRSASSGLFGTGEIHGYTPLLPHELTTNVLVLSALDSWAALMRDLGRAEESAVWSRHAGELRAAVERRLRFPGPGRGGVLYGGCRHEVDAKGLGALFYYEYDGLDVAWMPALGTCTERDPAWLATLEYLFSSRYELVLSRGSTYLWWEDGDVRGHRRKHTYPDPVGRLAFGQDAVELDRLLLDLAAGIEPGGLVARPQGLRRLDVAPARRMGAIAWLFLTRLLGLEVDGCTGTVTLRPRLRRRVIEREPGCSETRPVAFCFERGERRVHLEVWNRGNRPLRVVAGVRVPVASVPEGTWLDDAPVFGDTPARAETAAEGVAAETIFTASLLPGGRRAFAASFGRCDTEPAPS